MNDPTNKHGATQIGRTDFPILRDDWERANLELICHSRFQEWLLQMLKLSYHFPLSLIPCLFVFLPCPAQNCLDDFQSISSLIKGWSRAREMDSWVPSCSAHVGEESLGESGWWWLRRRAASQSLETLKKESFTTQKLFQDNSHR